MRAVQTVSAAVQTVSAAVQTVSAEQCRPLVAATFDKRIDIALGSAISPTHEAQYWPGVYGCKRLLLHTYALQQGSCL